MRDRLQLRRRTGQRPRHRRLFWYGGAAAAETLALSSADIFTGSTPEDGGYEDLILEEALARMGFALEIAHLPSERALINANEGIEDGNYSRVAGLERLYPNLVRVPEAIAGHGDTLEIPDQLAERGLLAERVVEDQFVDGAVEHPDRHAESIVRGAGQLERPGIGRARIRGV